MKGPCHREGNTSGYKSTFEGKGICGEALFIPGLAPRLWLVREQLGGDNDIAKLFDQPLVRDVGD
jgi:hypothetical protein